MDSILQKFQITALNPMQEQAHKTITELSDMVLLSPTGTGKTLAFLLPLIAQLDATCDEIQILILVPSRELAQQIEQVARKMGSGFKVNSVYGGRAGVLDKIDLKHRPAILIGTPGRVADRFRRDNFSLEHIKTLVLDEFDKSLEIGFEREMIEIVDALPNVRQRILTSATNNAGVPGFVGLKKPVSINFLKKEGSTQLTVKTMLSAENDKLKTLQEALGFLEGQPGIVFCNFKDTLLEVSDFLFDHNVDHECFHGGMEQFDRERALIKFRNGTCQLLLATDLAARGLDIPEIKFIIHFELPHHSKEFTHRNGRTARMNSEGAAYILHNKGARFPEFIQDISPRKLSMEDLRHAAQLKPVPWSTLYVTGGRRDKISKGDIAGLLIKQGQINKDQLGTIELQQNCAYVGVHKDIAQELIDKTNNSKLKKKKVRISLI
jgi:superfamily II DNA/RNA helicase